jgi:hypothetical protein
MNLRQRNGGKEHHPAGEGRSGEGRFETIESTDDVIKLAARAEEFDLVRDFGFPEDRLPALDRVTKLAIGSGIDALRDAGIPLVMRYKTTTKGTYLPDRWQLPTKSGMIRYPVLSIPGCDRMPRSSPVYTALAELAWMTSRLCARQAARAAATIFDQRMNELRQEIEAHITVRVPVRVLSMGHSQFAEYRRTSPNTATSSACASSTQPWLCQRWIRTGRCRRVVIVSATTSPDNLMGWFGSSFLASAPCDRRNRRGEYRSTAGAMASSSACASTIVISAIRARTRNPAHLPGPRFRDSQQRLSWNETRCGPHPPRHVKAGFKR